MPVAKPTRRRWRPAKVARGLVKEAEEEAAAAPEPDSPSPGSPLVPPPEPQHTTSFSQMANLLSGNAAAHLMGSSLSRPRGDVIHISVLDGKNTAYLASDIEVPSLLDFYISKPEPELIVQLEEICTLEAVFKSGYYDSFVVRNSVPLKTAIARVCPKTASRMKTDLHMTVAYPGRGEVPGLSVGFRKLFRHLPVLLHVKEIYVGDDVGSAVVFGIDAPASFTEPSVSNGRPAHLTLYGHPPVRAGSVLIGKQLALRKPFIQISEGYMQALLNMQSKFIDDLKIRQRETVRKLYEVEQHVGIIEKHMGVIGAMVSRPAMIIQTVLRRFLAQQLVARIRSSIVLQAAARRLLAQQHISRLRTKIALRARLTKSQYWALLKLVQSWKTKRMMALYDYDDYYDDYYDLW